MTLVPNPYAGPARAIRESGGTVLTLAGVSDGQYLKRSGSTIIGAAGGGAVPLAAGHLATSLITDLFVTLPATGYTTGTGASTGSLRGRPITFGRDCTLSSIGLVCAVGVATAKARVGLWEVGSDGYPTSLVVESGELDCSTSGRKLTTGLSVSLLASKTYFFATLGGTANPNLVVFNNTSPLNTGHVTATAAGTSFGVPAGFQVAQAYGEMPTTFPAGAAVQNTPANIAAPIFGVT